MTKKNLQIGHRLKAIRTLKKIEPLVMADKLSISESTYRRYERNESEPTLSILYKIADVFEIKITDLINDEMNISLPNLKTQEN
ncbi:helix-turn-helix domain-containing protein [Sphingobacterium siyangense]|uniref:helix-turn-helix domain-containing protein n=1 Tax=Sphingobacterium siyangense TaxID=459529 RepID=UPI0019662787|nr:helix-turn-helix transcriptional regulator [Sphingobacterium siyangense]QRY57221.1 helix-turn-helix transcriptional regulator [Sphingobacterium siyangense]